MTTADAILRQLGGKRFLFMAGATCYSDGENNETLVAKFKGSKAANIMYITLTSNDLYDVTIAKFRGMNVKVVKEVKGVYSDMLRSIFESSTGLYLSL